VLDPDMQDEVRVTVVATGLNRAAMRASDRGFESQRRPQMQVVATKRDGTTGLPIDDVASAYSPSVAGASGMPSFTSGLRTRAEPASSAPAAPASQPAVADFGGDSYLDIPAFLRRQAD
jgi:cell division protein FtsZ